MTMTITCATDFSDTAAGGASTAAILARAHRASLLLVHVVAPRTADAARAEAQARLGALAGELARRYEIEVEPRIAEGSPADEIVRHARVAAASLIVVGAVGHERLERWLVGSVAERVAQAALMPVLVVRDPAPFAAWRAGERPLRVMVGVEPTSSSRAALRWALELPAVGPCDLVVAQSVWPVERHAELGVPPPIPLDRLHPEVEAAAVRDLRRWTGPLPDSAHVVVRSGWGKVAAHLSHLAGELAADLVVVGTHQRAGLARLWQGSVSRGVLHDVTTNVVCVPGAVMDESARLPRMQTVLVTTDFSRIANRAIPYAYALAGAGGQVHLIHVSPRGDAPGELAATAARLRALIPATADVQGNVTTVEVVVDDAPAKAIAQYAARHGVDVVCMGTHGRTGVTGMVLGSQAAAVLQRCGRPVVLVPPERGEPA